MAWDKTLPPANRSLRLSHPDILANWAALEDALSREHDFPATGKHKLLTLADQELDPETPDSGKIVAYSKSQIPYLRNAAGTVLRLMTGEGGGATKCFFLQDTAPAGWTIETGCDDALLAVKGGSDAYNVAGGSKLKGTWTQDNHVHTGPSHVHTGPSHTHTTGDVTLTAAQSGLPDHRHYGVQIRAGDAGGSGMAYAQAGSTGYVEGGSRNASQAHNHGATGSSGTDETGASGTGNTGGAATAATYRPLANVGIIASLN